MYKSEIDAASVLKTCKPAGYQKDASNGHRNLALCLLRQIDLWSF